MNSLASHAFAPQPGRSMPDRTPPGAVGRAPDADSGVERCPLCGDPMRPGMRHCARCFRVVTVTAEQQEPAEAPAASRRAQPGAAYRLEAPARCPTCAKDVVTIRVLRALRTHVSFTSTLPRKGYVIACPECGAMLSAALSGII
ncbi:MAG: hypothetical protein HY655_08315 [Acidobacteria bacterium]|nr:hypothetical protein [Acidobacteriota bacterium]